MIWSRDPIIGFAGRDHDILRGEFWARNQKGKTALDDLDLGAIDKLQVFLDVHRMNRAEAFQALLGRLIYHFLDSEYDDAWLLLVHGRGLHSVSGTPVLKTCV